jgi:hypothetical protein
LTFASDFENIKAMKSTQLTGKEKTTGILRAYSAAGIIIGEAFTESLGPADLSAFLDTLQLDDTPFPERIEARNTAGDLLLSKTPREIVTESFAGNRRLLARELDSLNAWAKAVNI